MASDLSEPSKKRKNNLGDREGLKPGKKFPSKKRKSNPGDKEGPKPGKKFPKNRKEIKDKRHSKTKDDGKSVVDSTKPFKRKFNSKPAHDKEPKDAKLDHRKWKELTENRKRKRKPYYDLQKELVASWEKMRQRNIKIEERSKLISETMNKMKGKIPDIMGSHISSRVLQTCIKYCQPAERDSVYQELRPHFLKLARNTYAVHLVTKMLDHANKEQLQEIISSLHGHVVAFLRHPVGSAVVEHVFKLANGTQKQELLSEIYSAEFRIFKGIIPKGKGRLVDLLSGEHPSKKSAVLEHMTLALPNCRCQKTDRLNDIIGKEINGPVDMVAAEMNANNVLVDRIVADQVERKPRAGTPEKESHIEKEAWNLLRSSVVNYCGSPIGTIAANDPTDPSMLNYDQVFIRDFIPSGVAFLLKGEHDIVRNFILHTLQLQSWEKTMDCHSPGQGLMPASFKVRTVPRDGDDDATEDILDPDFGEAAIGRVAPVDSGLWWIILLRAYGKFTGDLSVQERTDVQTGIKMILKLCLADGFDMFPTLLVTDGSCMIDRRMGIHGHPLEIQALFYSALRCAREMLTPEDGSADLIRALNNRLIALSFHIREYYWVDMKKLNEIYRYKTEEYSYDAVNKFNIYPDQIPTWLVEWMPDRGGYFIGNLQPAHMDFRFFSLGNLWSIVCNLSTEGQSDAVLDLIAAKWNDLVADMPLKICYPALEGQEWQIITGSDPKNTPWSYHNGGSWPTLLWQLTVACIKMKRPELARKAVAVAEKRLSRDGWPEYYDTKSARFIGKQARLYQTWSIAGYLVSKLLLKNPEAAKILTCEEDMELLGACYSLLEANPKRKRARKKPTKSYIV